MLIAATGHGFSDYYLVVLWSYKYQGRRKHFTIGPAKLDPKHYSIKCVGGR